MPSVYILACDKVEQARAILSSEVWRDEDALRLMAAVIAQLYELDGRAIEQGIAGVVSMEEWRGAGPSR